MTDKRYDSGVIGNLDRIPNASLYCTYIYYISFEHKYLFQMEKKLYCMRTYLILFIFPMLLCNALCNKKNTAF